VVTDIDVTAAEVLKALDEELNDRGVHSAFVEPRDRLQDLVRRYDLNTTLDREHFYPSLDQGLDAINNAAEDSPMPPHEGMPPP
jgi:MFS superfamily sulfate permease-like transporter